jgi:hypothetical protein
MTICFNGIYISTEFPHLKTKSFLNSDINQDANHQERRSRRGKFTPWVSYHLLTGTQASGNLGPSIVQALLSSNFTVTALTRADSKSTLPAGVHVAKVDYADHNSLVAALRGQDAVVSSIATPALLQQKAIIEAAAEAGVKRFIPSEFGINTTKLPAGSGLEKILAGKLEVQKLLDEKVKSSEGFSWTGVSTSLFFDWVCVFFRCFWLE